MYVKQKYLNEDCQCYINIFLQQILEKNNNKI